MSEAAYHQAVDQMFRQEFEKRRRKLTDAALTLYGMSDTEFDALQQRCVMGIPRPSPQDNDRYGGILAKAFA